MTSQFGFPELGHRLLTRQSFFFTLDTRLGWTHAIVPSDNTRVHQHAPQQPSGNAHMRLNKSTSHAIRILIACTKADGKLVKAADLSANLEITLQNVFKIVHILSRAGLIAGQRGRNGGIALARPAKDIAVGDIVRAMEATEMELDVDGSKTASRTLRGVNRVLDDALGAFISVLDSHSLADMAKSATVSHSRAAPSKPGKRLPPKKTARGAVKVRSSVRSASG